MEKFPQRNSETSCVTPTPQVTEKVPTSKWGIKAGTQSHHRPQPTEHHTKLEENIQLPASAWGIKSLDPRASTPILRLPLEGQAPNHLVLKASRSLHSCASREMWQTKKYALRLSVAHGSMQREQAKLPFPSLPVHYGKRYGVFSRNLKGKGLTVYFTNYCLRV